MEIGGAEVRRLALLARIALEPEEVERLTHELRAILGLVDELRMADTRDIEAVARIAVDTAPPRADVPGEDPMRVAPADLAPAWLDGFFTVPRLAALDRDAVADDPSREA